MTTQIAGIKLVCPECRRENEPERIYCHDCGARLDRSALKKEQAKEEAPEVTQRRLKTLLDPRRGLLKRKFFRASKLVLGALLVAAIVQMFRSPDVPPAATSPEMPSQINLDLENAAMDPRTPPLHYKEAQVNSYLGYALKSKQTALSKYMKFERAVVAFEEGRFRITEERSLSGYSIFASANYLANLQNGKLDLKVVGGHIGRLPIHPALMQYGSVIFSDLAGALERERKSIVKLGGVELHPQAVTFIPRQPPQS